MTNQDAVIFISSEPRLTDEVEEEQNAEAGTDGVDFAALAAEERLMAYA